jgi:hypothetical protein
MWSFARFGSPVRASTMCTGDLSTARRTPAAHPAGPGCSSVARVGPVRGAPRIPMAPTAMSAPTSLLDQQSLPYDSEATRRRAGRGMSPSRNHIPSVTGELLGSDIVTVDARSLENGP